MDATQAHLSLHLSKRHIFENHVSVADVRSKEAILVDLYLLLLPMCGLFLVGMIFFSFYKG